MNTKKKSLRRFIGGVSVIIFMYVAFGGEYNLYNLWEIYHKKHTLLEDIKQSEVELEQLRLEIKWLNNDSTYIEKIARERYKMGKKGEKIYLITSEDKSE